MFRYPLPSLTSYPYLPIASEPQELVEWKAKRRAMEGLLPESVVVSGRKGGTGMVEATPNSPKGNRNARREAKASAKKKGGSKGKRKKK